MPLLSRVEFEWMVASKGYTIIEHKQASETIRRSVRFPSERTLRVTRPVHQYPGLFKEFAKLEPTAAGVVRFANRFGLLHSDPNQNGLRLLVFKFKRLRRARQRLQLVGGPKVK